MEPSRTDARMKLKHSVLRTGTCFEATRKCCREQFMREDGCGYALTSYDQLI